MFDRDIFFRTFFAESDSLWLDVSYMDIMYEEIVAHEPELLTIIAKLAPKFDIQTLPTLHIIILFISLVEILYFNQRVEEVADKIPESVSINEAIELAKKFSDDHGKNFINGTLSTFLKEKTTLVTLAPVASFSVLFPSSEKDSSVTSEAL